MLADIGEFSILQKLKKLMDVVRGAWPYRFAACNRRLPPFYKITNSCSVISDCSMCIAISAALNALQCCPSLRQLRVVKQGVRRVLAFCLVRHFRQIKTLFRISYFINRHAHCAYHVYRSDSPPCHPLINNSRTTYAIQEKCFAA